MLRLRRKKALVVFSSGQTKLILIALAINSLTKKEKISLRYIKNLRIATNITAVADVLSKEVECSKSSIWANINSLRKKQLIISGTSMKKRVPVSLTGIGRILAENLEKQTGGSAW